MRSSLSLHILLLSVGIPLYEVVPSLEGQVFYLVETCKKKIGDNLLKHRLIGLSVCSLCLEEGKTVDHLLVNCCFSD